ncbi:DNA repair protein RecO [Hugenholtzia roseola]|uniref:DNA repair protein RecO n=1 Tax=Hugenholtzia roseola TaxID=1002 RepID=UPI0004133C94|nr:DNA repair protein RecO [Hugenholtzia roseola]
MLEKTAGIVLGYTPYGESSIICKIFTEKFGNKSYLIKGVKQKSKAAQKKLALYQPLYILDLVVYNRPNKGLNYISDAQILYAYAELPFEIRKTTISLFLTEVLRKCLQEEERQPDLYHFLVQSFTTLDQLPTQYENFHLQFLLKLITFLGFGIEKVQDLLEMAPNHFPLDEEGLLYMELLWRSPYQEAIPPISLRQRRILLDSILRFYKSQIEEMHFLRSLPVLKSVFE